MHSILLAIALLGTSPAIAGITVAPHEFRADNGTVVKAEYGKFEVPRHHAEPDGATFTLHLVRFPSTNPNPGSPIVYLAGGPGGSGISAAEGPRFELFMALREVADVIALDQRGTGASAVGPDCQPPLTAFAGRVLTQDTFEAYLDQAASYCRAWWKDQAVDLSAYTTMESAADLEILRRQIGAGKLNLWGISYGTHLALAAARQMGDRIDRMVLASVEGTDQTLKLPAHTDAFLGRVNALLQSHPKAHNLPPLPDLMRHVLGKLEQEPVKVTFVPEDGIKPVTMTLGAYPVRLFTASGLIKNPEDIRNLPGLYAMMAMGNYQIVARELDKSVASGGMAFSPMSVGMDIASGVSPERLATFREQAKTAILGDVLNFPLPRFLGKFDVPDLGEAFRAPVKTSAPVLVLTGTLDGRTYPDEHREILDALENGQQLVIENAGHDLFLSDPRVGGAIVDFFSGRKVDAKIITIPPPEFALDPP